MAQDKCNPIFTGPGVDEIVEQERAQFDRKARDKELSEHMAATVAENRAAQGLESDSFAEVITTLTGKSALKTLVKKRPLSEQQMLRGIAKYERMLHDGVGGMGAILRTMRDVPEELKAYYGLIGEGSLNLKDLMVEEDAVKITQAITSLTNAAVPVTTEGQLLLDALPVFQDLVGMDRAGMAEFFARKNWDVAEARNAMVAGTIMLPNAMEDVLRATQDAIKSNGVIQAMPDITTKVAHLETILRGVQGIASEGGLLLRARQMNVGSEVFDMARTILDEANGIHLSNPVGAKEMQRRIEQIDMFRDWDKMRATTGMGRWATMSGLDRVIALTNEVFISNLLSSPKTLVTNILFPSMTAMWVPIENMLGAAAFKSGMFGKAGKVTGEQVWIENKYRMLGTLQALVDGSALAKGTDKWYKRIQPITEGGSNLAENIHGPRYFRSENFLSQPEEMQRTAFLIDIIGKGINFPNPIMRKSDDFIKQVSGRGEIMGKLMGAAHAANVPTAERSSWVAERMEKIFVDGQLITEKRITKMAQENLARKGEITSKPTYRSKLNEERQRLMEEADFATLNPIAQSGIDAGAEVTLTSDLTPGSMGHSFTKLSRNHPWTRLIVPFQKTPINAMQFVGQRLDLFSTPAAWLQKKLSAPGMATKAIEESKLRNLREWHSADPRKRVEVVGRHMGAVAMMSAATGFAMSGKITGAGPDDPEQRDLLKSTGWMPYSIVTSEGKYIQYLRADPLSSFIGIAADMIEVTSRMTEDDESIANTITHGVLTSAINNLVQKTYVSGLRNFFDAMSDSERFTGNFLEGLVGSVIPRSVQSAVSLFDDPVLKETSGMLDAIKSRVPGMSRFVPPQRNVLGEPIRRSSGIGGYFTGEDSVAALSTSIFLPIAYREVKNTAINKEFQRLRTGFSPPPRKRYGIELTTIQNEAGRYAYDRWGELQGKVRIGGRSLAQTLNSLVTSNSYKSLTDDDPTGSGSPKVQAIRKVLKQYKSKSFSAMLEEFPTLRSEITQKLRDKDRVRGRSFGFGQ